MTVAIFLIALVILTAAFFRFRDVRGNCGDEAPLAIAPARASPAPAAALVPAVLRVPVPVALAEPRLEVLEWDAGSDCREPAAMPPAQARIRDRYLAVRFEGAIRNAGDLRLTDRVIEVARLYFEEDRADRAQELLALAIEASPCDASLRLALVEIAFLTRDASGFLDAARSLNMALPECEQWEEVQRLGRALLAQEPLFGAAAQVRAHEHYGAWPDTPNWIGACWDLTGEVRAADFHLAMSRAAPQGHAAFRAAA